MGQKLVRAVSPYEELDGINFKGQAYNAWCRVGGKTAPSFYPYRFLHGAISHVEIPTLFRSRKEARLRYVQSCSIRFDTFPDYTRHEIIPMIWDCWPMYYRGTCDWLKKHKVHAAIFTSSQTAEKIQSYIPDLKTLSITEGIDVEKYPKGEELRNRKNRLFEIGAKRRCYIRTVFPQDYMRLSSLPLDGLIKGWDSFIDVLCDTKVTVLFPRCDVMPKEYGDIETLTQRYWEVMLTRIVPLGRAPRELVEHIGYNPVIDLDKSDPIGQIEDLLAHIEDYQPLVDKNREVALRMAPWELRMKKVMDWLQDLGYEV